MKKALGIFLTFLIMFTAGCGNNYTDYPVYQIENTGIDSYVVTLSEDERYSTREDNKWFPISIDNETILGTCDYNGTVLIHPTSSEICVYITNIDSMRKPTEYLYREDAILPEISANTIGKIRYVAYEGLHTSDSLEKVITNTAQIEKVISVMDNQTEYIELDWNDPANEIDMVGLMILYSDDLAGMEASIEIAKCNGENYYVIENDLGLLSLVNGDGIIPLD